MNITSPRKHISIGLHESGKSTFLGALWHVVDSEEVPGSLRLKELGPDREYIEALREAWLTRTKIERNKLDDRHLIWMQLKAAHTEDVVELVFPDLAGELFEQQWRDRIWTHEFSELIAEASGLLLFLHAEQQHKPIHISDMNEEARNAGAELEPVEFDADEVPLQVKLVEILQFIAQYSPQSKPISLAVIVSAWDVVEESAVLMGLDKPEEPDKHFIVLAPLVHQYLTANPEQFNTTIFGVSALGGDLETHRARLEDIKRQSERIKVRQQGNTTSDITNPIKWLMGHPTL